MGMGVLMQEILPPLLINQRNIDNNINNYIVRMIRKHKILWNHTFFKITYEAKKNSYFDNLSKRKILQYYQLNAQVHYPLEFD